MKLDPEIIRQLILTFSVELEEQLQVITNNLLALEKGAADADRTASLESLFRAAHNIKGSARGIGAQAVADIAHSLETLFTTLRKGAAAALSVPAISLCLQSLDGMREAMAAFAAGQPLTFDLPSLLDRLDHWQDNGSGEFPPLEERAELPAAPVEPAEPPREALQPPAKEAIGPGAGSETARIALFKIDRVSALMEDLLASKIEMEDHTAALQGLNEEARAFARLWTQLASEWQRGGLAGAPGGAPSHLVSVTEAINRLSTGSQRIYKQMRASTSQLGLIAGTLQDQTRMMRLVPVATLLRPLARPVRDIALELGKRIDYTVIGDDIEMDRPVLEGIKDPLVHLLRNAIDHGIESPDERRAKGKPETGRLTVTVSALGGRIVITVQDDGAGISADRIAKAAVKRKLLTAAEAEALPPAEILDLIFRPGFSSKEIITDISGRGVGLDVVLSNLRALKGSVRVETREGAGTSFVINLPMTLTTDRGLMVRVGGTLFAIPSAAVDQVMEVKADELFDVQASQAIILQGKAVPIRDLATVLELGHDATAPRGRVPVVVISKGWQSVALLVEKIIGEREIVIKPLQRPLISVRNVTGGTLTGSGKVVIVLNPLDLVGSALRAGAVRLRGQHQDEAQAQVTRVLVVDDSITTRTLEKNILESLGYQVTVAVDGQLGWEALQEQDFALVVTDVEMPVMNGFALAERIKTSDKYRDIPVVMVTSRASEADRRRGIEVGADAYIVKGQFETKVLLDVIQQLI